MKNKVRYIDRSDCEYNTKQNGSCKSHWEKIITIPQSISKYRDFDIYFCKRCKLGFSNPYPSEDTLHILYDSKFNCNFDLITGGIFDKIKDFWASVEISKMTNNKNINAVLDYSTGNGRYALAAAKLFPDAKIDALDYQTEAPSLIKKHGTRIGYYFIDDFENSKKKYDLIILRHVLEHSHHPMQLLLDLKNRLTQKGILYVEVPNLESGCAKVFKKYWIYKPPYHIFYFTKYSLNKMCKVVGLKGDVKPKELPFMGSLLSIVFETEYYSLFNRFMGALLYPIQLLIEKIYRSSSCLSVCLSRT